MGIMDAFSSAEKISKKRLEDFKGLDGLEEIIEKILDLCSSEIYWDFFNAFNLEGKIWEDDIDFIENEKNDITLINIAKENLSNPPLRISPLVDLIACSL